MVVFFLAWVSRHYILTPLIVRSSIRSSATSWWLPLLICNEIDFRNTSSAPGGPTSTGSGARRIWAVAPDFPGCGRTGCRARMTRSAPRRSAPPAARRRSSRSPCLKKVGMEKWMPRRDLKKVGHMYTTQGDQIGRIFAFWAFVYFR
jgi:hypothetical protein